MVTEQLPEKARRGDEEAMHEAIDAVPLAMVLTDPRQDDNPITYVNQAFERVTLYSRRFAVGRNCRFLQGEDIDLPVDLTASLGLLATELITNALEHAFDGRTAAPSAFGSIGGATTAGGSSSRMTAWACRTARPGLGRATITSPPSHRR